MTAAEMVAYAYGQIDQARAELTAVSKETRYETALTAEPSSGNGVERLSRFSRSETPSAGRWSDVVGIMDPCRRTPMVAIRP